MTSIRDAIAVLHAALATVEALDGGVTEDPGSVVWGTATAMIAPPSVTWGSFGGSEPTEASVIVHLVVPFDEYATGRLYDLVEPMVAAIEGNSLFTVSSASPGLLQTGGNTQLPTYAITVDVGL